MSRTKNNVTFLLTIVTATLTIGLAACHKEETTEGGDELTRILQANAWIDKYTYADERSVYEQTDYLYFTSEDSGLKYWQGRETDAYLGKSSSKGYSEFTYYVSGNKVVIDYEDYDYTDETLNYSGGNLIDNSESSVYEPRTMTSDDYSLIKSLLPETNTTGSITYTYDKKNQELTISGNGDMPDYTTTNQPWSDYNIKSLIIKEGVTSIGNNAFNNNKHYNSRFTEVTLPNIHSYFFMKASACGSPSSFAFKRFPSPSFLFPLWHWAIPLIR